MSRFVVPVMFDVTFPNGSMVGDQQMSNAITIVDDDVSIRSIFIHINKD